MSLRRNLTFQSTFVFAVTLAVVFTGTYIAFRKHTQTLFFNKLADRALIAGFVYFEKDEATRQNYARKESVYQVRLTDEVIQVYDREQKLIFEDHGPSAPLSPAQVREIAAAGRRNFYAGDRQAVGIFYQDNQGDFVIVASGVDATGESRLQTLALTMLVFFFGGIGLNLLLNAVLSRRTFRPFAETIRHVNRISTDNLHLRLPERSGSRDELQQLIATFNHFLNRLETGVRSRKLFVRHASHELKTPLAALIGNLQVSLQENRPEAEYREILRNALDDAEHLQSILEGLLLLSNLDSEESFPVQDVQIDEILWDVLGKLAYTYPQHPIEVEIETEKENADWLCVRGNEGLLAIALKNILENAVKFSGNRSVEVRVYDDNGPEVWIEDHGSGIPAGEQQAVFDLFFRGSNAGTVPGHGMGLPLVRRILELHGFSLELTSEPGKGSVFLIRFHR